MKKCKFCDEEIKDDALKCEHCNKSLSIQTKQEINKKIEEQMQQSKALLVGGIVFGVISSFVDFSLGKTIGATMFWIGLICFLVIRYKNKKVYTKSINKKNNKLNMNLNIKKLEKEIECYQCKNKIKHYSYGRNMAIEIILFVLCFAYFIGVIPLIIYYACTTRWICPVCGAKYK